MAVYEFFWKIWLRLNLLTKDVDNDYTAEVSTMKNTFRNEDIARAIVVEGSEIKFDTMLSIINKHDRIIREKVQRTDRNLPVHSPRRWQLDHGKRPVRPGPP